MRDNRGVDRRSFAQDFFFELMRDSQRVRAVYLAGRLIVQKQEQALLFRSFVEGTLADDRVRARLGAELREQRTPEESLFLLRSGLSAQQGIIDHLLRVEFTPQQVFVDVGRALQHRSE